MAAPKIIFDEVSAVLIGDFNPVILHPSWFARHNLLSAKEADDAKLEICFKEITRFSLPWLHLEATTERFVCKSSDSSHFNPLRDLVIGTFELLGHTPIRQLGINRTVHFDVIDQDTWHAVGHKLAPKDIWKEFLETPGLHSLTIEGVRTDKRKGLVNVTVRPVPNVDHEVSVAVNDHYELGAIDAGEAISLLKENWEVSLKTSEKWSTLLLERALS